MKIQKTKRDPMKELARSLRQEIDQFKQSWTEMNGQEIEWEAAAIEWFRSCFPQWKRMQWEVAVQEATLMLEQESRCAEHKARARDGSDMAAFKMSLAHSQYADDRCDEAKNPGAELRDAVPLLCLNWMNARAPQGMAAGA